MSNGEVRLTIPRRSPVHAITLGAIAMLSVEIIVFCEDFFEHTAQVIHRRQIIGYGNSTNSLAVEVILCAPPSNSRYQRNPRSKTSVAAEPRWVIRG